MDLSQAIRVSGLLRVLLTDEAVRERLRERPDWRVGLYKQLVRLKDPLPSDVEIMVLSPNNIEFQRDVVPIIPRLARIATTYVNVGGIEVHIRDGELIRLEGSDPVPLTAADLLPRGIAMMPEYPIMPGVIALTFFVPPDASAAEWRERSASAWADMQLVREAQQRAWYEAAVATARERLSDAKRELDHADGGNREMLLGLIPSLERHLGELERAPDARTRIRIDLPFRELVWLRKFVGEGKAAIDIAAEWEDQLAVWNRGVRAKSADDLVLEAAYDEWMARSRRTSSASVDTSTVERSLKRWLGRILGPHPQTR